MAPLPVKANGVTINQICACGKMLTKHSLSILQFIIEVADSGSLSLSSQAEFTLNIIDVNDNPPLFSVSITGGHADCDIQFLMLPSNICLHVEVP